MIDTAWDNEEIMPGMDEIDAKYKKIHAFWMCCKLASSSTYNGDAKIGNQPSTAYFINCGIISTTVSSSSNGL